MNKVVKMFLNLIVMGLAAGIILALMFGVADPLIKENKARELREAIFLVLPEAKDFVKVTRTVGKEEINIYIGVDDVRSPVGVAFKADGNGFSGNVGVMVGLDTDYLKLKGIEVLEQLETPGLGDRIREPEFKDQFVGVDVTPKVEYIKYRKPEKPNQIQAITGATISSNAVVTNINNAIKKVVESLPKGDLAKEVSSAPAPGAEPSGADNSGGDNEEGEE